MSFLTNRPDLSATMYATQSQYLQEIRDFLVAEIQNIAPIWLTNPKGILGKHWNSDEPDSTCYLMWIANMLKYLSNKTEQDSYYKLHEKFKLLLYADEPMFSEYLTELEVAWGLAGRVSPLLIEPLAFSNGSTNSSNPAKSPDFAFDLENRVYLEVTTFYVGILEKWQRAVDYITATIRHRLNKRGRNLKFHMQLPLSPFEAKQSQKFDANRIVEHIWRKIVSTDQGELTIVPNGTIRWEPYSITTVQEDSTYTSPTTGSGSIIPTAGGWEALIRFTTLQDNPSGFVDITPFGVFHTPDYLVDQATYIKEPDIVVLSENDVQAANEFVLKSLKHKIKVDKREQFPLRRQNPYLLVIRLGHYRLQGNGLVELIQQEIWSDKNLDWITGIILFTPRQGFKISHKDKGGQFTICLNPNAACPASELLNAMIDEQP